MFTYKEALSCLRLKGCFYVYPEHENAENDGECSVGLTEDGLPFSVCHKMAKVCQFYPKLCQNFNFCAKFVKNRHFCVTKVENCAKSHIFFTPKSPKS